MDDFKSQTPFYKNVFLIIIWRHITGDIFFYNQTDEGYREVAIQPKENSDITVLSTGRSEKLKTLEEVIKSELDDPDDFINSLIEE